MPLANKAPGRIPMSRLMELAATSGKNLEALRKTLLQPSRSKKPPTLSTGRLATLCGISNDQVLYRVSRGDLPNGTVASNNRRNWNVAQAGEWARAYRAERLRPSGARAVTISIGNFKGGVTKTTTCMTLAQGLALRGHRVLAIDLDPQGSLTNLFGLLPDGDVDANETLLPLFAGQEEGVGYAIRPSYWPGIDLIPAMPGLYNAEFYLPTRQIEERESGLRFYDILNAGLESVRDRYDVIIIDTAPSLSYTVMNAYMASDGMIVPMPPNALDFASSAQFWSLFTDLVHGMRDHGAEREFDFMHVLLAKVDAMDDNAPVVASWIAKTYNEFVLPVEIPKTNVASKSSIEFGTVFDVTRYEGGSQTFKKAADAYNRVVDIVEQSIGKAWLNQLADQSPTVGNKSEVVA
ncbi:MAG: AAA family ATPase [Burkholderiales bacterium]|nr:AAA family ATPase [Burkholderiales bacterium]